MLSFPEFSCTSEEMQADIVTVSILIKFYVQLDKLCIDNTAITT